MPRSSNFSRMLNKKNAYYVSWAAVSFLLVVVFAFLLLSYRNYTDAGGVTRYYWSNPFGNGVTPEILLEANTDNAGLYVFFWVAFFLSICLVVAAHSSMLWM